MELAEVPAGDLANDIVESRLEESRRIFCHRILQLEQAIAETEFRCNESQRIAGGFGGQGRRTAQARVHLDHTVIHRIGIIGILHVAFAHDAYVADYLYRQFAQIVVIVVGECLRGCDNDTLAGVYA